MNPNETIRCERHGSIAVVVIDNPSARNALAGSAMRAIAEHLDAASADPTVRAVVITGGAGQFCAGASLGDDAAGASEDASTGIMADASAMIRAVVGASVPVIAAVDGPAAGIGASLAFASDQIVASEKAFFLLPFGKLGLIPDGGVTLSAAASLGRHRAMRLALAQERLPVTEAADAGLVSEVVSPGYATEAALNLARSLVANASRDALAETKRAINQATLGRMDEVLDHEGQVQNRLLDSDDYREGLAAFRERRAPKFSGSDGQ